MKIVEDVMDRDPLVVSPEIGVGELARRMIEHNVDGACVVQQGKLVGVVTSMDLVFQEKNVHLPTVFAFMDALIPLDFSGRTRKELEKITATDVEHIMSREVFTASPGDEIDEVATTMVEEHYSYVPVLDGDAIIGVVDRKTMLKAAAAD